VREPASRRRPCGPPWRGARVARDSARVKNAGQPGRSGSVTRTAAESSLMAGVYPRRSDPTQNLRVPSFRVGDRFNCVSAFYHLLICASFFWERPAGPAPPFRHSFRPLQTHGREDPGDQRREPRALPVAPEGSRESHRIRREVIGVDNGDPLRRSRSVRIPTSQHPQSALMRGRALGHIPGTRERGRSF